MPEAAGLRAADPPDVAREPLFLGAGPWRNARTLCGDFASFTLVLLYYLLCWSWGGAAFICDNTFGTREFDRFVRFAERMDNGGR